MFGGEIGFWEILIILIAGVVLFGKSLPDVGRSLGKTWFEFKRGLKGLEDQLSASLGDVSSTLNSVAEPTNRRPTLTPAAPPPPRRVATAAPKFQDEPIDSLS